MVFFSSLLLQVMEGQASGFLIGTVHAKDPDEGENGSVTYALSGRLRLHCMQRHTTRRNT